MSSHLALDFSFLDALTERWTGSVGDSQTDPLGCNSLRDRPAFTCRRSIRLPHDIRRRCFDRIRFGGHYVHFTVMAVAACCLFGQVASTGNLRHELCGDSAYIYSSIFCISTYLSLTYPAKRHVLYDLMLR